jgi:hypothetical protein
MRDWSKFEDHVLAELRVFSINVESSSLHCVQSTRSAKVVVGCCQGMVLGDAIIGYDFSEWTSEIVAPVNPDLMLLDLRSVVFCGEEHLNGHTCAGS